MQTSEWIWKEVTIGVVKQTNVLQPQHGPVDTDAVHPVPVERRWPGLAGTPLLIADAVPRGERLSIPEHFALDMVLEMKHVVPLSAAYPEPYLEPGSPYYPEYQALGPAPVLPADFRPGGDPIAGVAARGPFALLTRRAGDGFELDMRHIEALEPRAGFLRQGGLARIERRGPDLATAWIELDGNRHQPGDAGWALVEKRFLAGLNTHMTLVEHLVGCHMSVGESHALAAVEVLPGDHPLRALLQPFAVETLRVNGDNIDGLIQSEDSNVPCYSGYRLEVINAVIREAAQGFDFRRMDPVWRATDQGTLDAGFPTIDAGIALFAVFQRLCDRYLHEVVGEVDASTRAWCQLVDTYIPGGVRAVAGIGDWRDLTLAQVAHVLAVLAYTSSVTHYLVAVQSRDYMMAFHVMPPSVAADGFPTRGMVLEKMNSITIANILRYRLMDEAVLPAGRARALWDAFQAELQAVQAAYDAAPPEQRPYLIPPAQVPSSIHA